MQLSNSLTPRSIASSNYLLRQYGGAAAAYSLQRLDTSTGNVVRARRSTDDAESNFTAEGVSGGSLREFALNNDADLIRFANQATAADKRMYFDGVDDYISVTQIDFTGDFDISFSLQCNYGASRKGIMGHSTTSFLRFNATNSIQLNIGGSSVFLSVSDIDQLSTYRLVRTGSSIELFQDGVSVDTDTLAGTFSVSRIGVSYSTTEPMDGIIYDVDLGVAAYQGYGNTDADWEDQVGSNDGTVSGSPALFSGQGFDAYVTTLYDQSGNGRNATQATAASQPQIVADGVVVTDTTGVPALDFDGTDDTYTLPDQGSLTAFSILAVASYAGADGAAKGIFSPGTGADSSVMLSRLSASGAKWGTAGTTANSDFSTISLLVMLSSDGDSGTFYKDGSADGTFASTIGQPPHIGGKSGQEMQGKISEIIYYDTDQSANRAAIEANIAARYGITLA